MANEAQSDVLNVPFFCQPKISILSFENCVFKIIAKKLKFEISTLWVNIFG